MPDSQVLRTKRDDARHEVRNLIVMQLHPNQLLAKPVLLRHLERSARAEAKLRQAALAHQESRQPQPASS